LASQLTLFRYEKLWRAVDFYAVLGYEESAAYFRKRLLHGSREKFDAVLAKVASAPPDPRDTAV